MDNTAGDNVIELDAPTDSYNIATLLRDNERFGIDRIISRTYGEVAAAVSGSVSTRSQANIPAKTIRSQSSGIRGFSPRPRKGVPGTYGSVASATPPRPARGGKNFPKKNIECGDVPKGVQAVVEGKATSIADEFSEIRRQKDAN
jgi:hypothetical protein